MSCKDLGPPLNMDDFGLEPKGNTYEITIGIYDTIIIHLKHEEAGINITSRITPAITAGSTSENGKYEVEAEYFVHQIKSVIQKK